MATVSVVEKRENECCEVGCFDRKGTPCCCLKAWPTAVHYEGCGLWAILLFCCPLFCCCWNPTLQTPGDEIDPNNAENPCCAKGCYDRHRQPNSLLKCLSFCLFHPAVAHYEGCCSCMHFLSCVCGNATLGLLSLLWNPTVQKKTVLLGAPVPVMLAAPVMMNMQPGPGQYPGPSMQPGYGQMQQQQPVMQMQPGYPMQQQQPMMAPTAPPQQY